MSVLEPIGLSLIGLFGRKIGERLLDNNSIAGFHALGPWVQVRVLWD